VPGRRFVLSFSVFYALPVTSLEETFLVHACSWIFTPCHHPPLPPSPSPRPPSLFTHLSLHPPPLSSSTSFPPSCLEEGCERLIFLLLEVLR